MKRTFAIMVTGLALLAPVAGTAAAPSAKPAAASSGNIVQTAVVAG